MDSKALRVRHTRDQFGKPSLIVLNVPPEGMAAGPVQLRPLGAILAKAVHDAKLRNADALPSDRVIEYPFAPAAGVVTRR